MIKGLDALEEISLLVDVRKEHINNYLNIIEKELKALEIIGKRFGPFILTVIEDDLRTLKEERELLKEVLL